MTDNTKTETITLIGNIEYHPNFPPRDAKKGYVAKIKGRAPGAVKFEREFLGDRVTLVSGDEGLYETQTGLKKGGCNRFYYVVLEHPEHGLIRSTDCEDQLPKIAKALDEGISIADAVEIKDLRASERTPGLWFFDVAARDVRAAKAAAAAATIDEAVTACLSALSGLSATDRKKAIGELRKRAEEAV